MHAQLIRYLANGPKTTPGRLLVSNKKIRFIGTGGGQTNWDKIVGVRAEYRNLVVSAATARGAAQYTVADVDYVAAVTEGALRIAKRQVLAPGNETPVQYPSTYGQRFSDAAGVVASNADRRPTSNTTT